MESAPPPPSPHIRDSGRYIPIGESGWERVEAKVGSVMPCQRSLHAGAVWNDFFVIFGGYDGHHRVNDLYSFNFNTSYWQLLSGINAPSPRDRHVAVVFDSSFYVFGGFDGVARVNDMHAYDLELNEWRSVVVAGGNPPSARHSHAAVVYSASMFIFGGYDGSYRNDFHEFNFTQGTWHQVQAQGEPPRARYRGTCVVSGDSMILHGGHDGSRHLQDTHVFDFISLSWSSLITEGPVPSPRDSHIAVIYNKNMFLYGGSTGSAMGDFHELKLEFRRVWSPVVAASAVAAAAAATAAAGTGTIAGGSRQASRRITGIGGSMGVTGGGNTWRVTASGPISTTATTHNNNNSNNSNGSNRHGRGGSPTSMFYRSLGSRTDNSRGSYPNHVGSASAGNINNHNSNNSNNNNLAMDGTTGGGGGGGGGGHTAPMLPSWNGDYDATLATALEITPGVRFCHVGVVHENYLYIFGGYDGSRRLNDFMRYKFDQDEPVIASSPSTLISDLRKYVNSDLLSDITFIVEDIPVPAHKVLCLRCPFFYNMLTGEYMESRAAEVPILDVKHSTFLMLLEYLYTDEVEIGVENAMELFQVADRFGIDRLKKMCEQEMLNAINIETAAHILYTADQHNAENLRERCMSYILIHFDEVSRTSNFEEMGRTNVELVFEILKRR